MFHLWILNQGPTTSWLGVTDSWPTGLFVHFMHQNIRSHSSPPKDLEKPTFNTHFSSHAWTTGSEVEKGRWRPLYVFYCLQGSGQGARRVGFSLQLFFKWNVKNRAVWLWIFEACEFLGKSKDLTLECATKCFECFRERHCLDGLNKANAYFFQKHFIFCLQRCCSLFKKKK